MNSEKVSKLIKDIRKNNNLSQKDFAAKFGVTYQAVSKWENGKNIPDIAIIREICKEYNISIDELLDNPINKEKKSNNIFLIIIIALLIIIGIFSYFRIRSDNFEFKTISSNCNNFNVNGSMAYNKDKTSIYISEINYCGKEESEKYQTINCTLYEDNGNTKNIIEKCPINNDITLENFLKNISFHVDNYSTTCKQYKENSLYLEIETKDDKNNIKSFKIPLKLSDNCK